MNINEAASKLGKLGGSATLKKHGKKHFSEAGTKGMAKRWKDHKKKIDTQIINSV